MPRLVNGTCFDLCYTKTYTIVTVALILVWMILCTEQELQVKLVQSQVWNRMKRGTFYVVYGYY